MVCIVYDLFSFIARYFYKNRKKRTKTEEKIINNMMFVIVSN